MKAATLLLVPVLSMAAWSWGQGAPKTGTLDTEQFRTVIRRVIEGASTHFANLHDAGNSELARSDAQLTGWEACRVSADMYSCRLTFAREEEAASKVYFQQLRGILYETLSSGWELHRGSLEPSRDSLYATQIDTGAKLKLFWDNRVQDGPMVTVYVHPGSRSAKY